MTYTVSGIIRYARRQAYKVVYREVRAVLPPGWRMDLAVGWGLCLTDADGNTVFGTYTDAPARMPKGVRRACLIAADFVDTFGYANEVIYARRKAKRAL